VCRGLWPFEWCVKFKEKKQECPVGRPCRLVLDDDDDDDDDDEEEEFFLYVLTT
jgi:hypothetical protein